MDAQRNVLDLIAENSFAYFGAFETRKPCVRDVLGTVRSIANRVLNYRVDTWSRSSEVGGYRGVHGREPDYGDVGYWNGIVRIGRFNGDDLAFIRGQSDGFQVTIEEG